MALRAVLAAASAAIATGASIPMSTRLNNGVSMPLLSLGTAEYNRTSLEQAIATKDRVREINKYAKVVGAVKGRVKMEELVNIRAHDMCNFVNMDIEKEGVSEAIADAGHGGRRRHHWAVHAGTERPRRPGGRPETGTGDWSGVNPSAC